MRALNGNRSPSPRARGLPPVFVQVRHAAAAATRALGATLAGRSVIVPKEVLAARETLCAACEENLSGRCRKCGCGVRSQFIRKTHLATERCPLNPPTWDVFVS